MWHLSKHNKWITLSILSDFQILTLDQFSMEEAGTIQRCTFTHKYSIKDLL